MNAARLRTLQAGSLGLGLAACYPDVVEYGDYGAEDAGDAAASSPPSTTGDDTPEPPDVPGEGGAKDAGSKGEGGSAGPSSSPGSSAGPCDLTGRWIVTNREVTSALGAQQANHRWYYYELTQSGSKVTVSKGLDCGGNSRALTAIGATVDFPKVWPAALAKDPQTGRVGTSTASGATCAVSFERRYTVMGATVPHYDDPGRALPTTDEKASGNTPGWEDWDGDGKPGYTLGVTGLATGKLYLASREWHSLSGTLAAGASTFKLATKWNTEQVVLGYDGSDLLTSTASATVDSNASLHFAQFARLADAQATGDDSAVCASIRDLAAKLTPDAAN